MQQPATPERPALLRAAGLTRLFQFRMPGLGLFLLALALSLNAESVDPYGTLLDEHFAGEKKSYRSSASQVTNTFDANLLALEEAVKKETIRKAKGTGKLKPPPVKIKPENVAIGIALMLIATLVFRKLIGRLDAQVVEWSNSSPAAWHLQAEIAADEKFLTAFLTEFRNGPSEIVAGETTAIDAFLSKSPDLLKTLKGLLQKITSAQGSGQQQLLADLRRELRGFKGEAGISELLPAWQTASALEGLVQQLADHPGHMTQSTLRTVAGGLDLLEQLCRPGLRSDLLSNPPLRLLAVDDDLISRKAISLALKKSLNEPELAEVPEKALAMATMQAYDVIFLDVQMPGMDGFELCTKIHETVPNAKTPVVFVTCMSDFDSRARSVLSGGSDLIGKPFLTFEIAVKALTLALRSRLQTALQSSGEHLMASHPKIVMTAFRDTHNRTASPLDSMASARHPAIATGSRDVMRDELVSAFLIRTTDQLGTLRQRVQAIFQATNDATRQEMLADFYLKFMALLPEAGSAKEHPALRMMAAVEGLLKKLLQKPSNCTSSTLFTLATAVDVLDELCAPGVRDDLASNPPIHMLVADDDPVARRAIVCALQTTFEKPEDVECGESALAATQAKAFDVIFLDVQMPRMDGFTASAKIRENGPNRTTPVVFVTNHSDFKARNQANLSGGNDLVAKPFLTAEITVKALTFALRGRLLKARVGSRVSPSQVEMAVAEATANPGSERVEQRRQARRRARRFKGAGQSWHSSS